MEIYYRSNSCVVPSIDVIGALANCLDFVPKLKPKKNNNLPPPMALNSKTFKELKKNKVTKILLENNHM